MRRKTAGTDQNEKDSHLVGSHGLAPREMLHENGEMRTPEQGNIAAISLPVLTSPTFRYVVMWLSGHVAWWFRAFFFNTS